MTQRNFGILFFALLVSFPLFGQTYNVTPSSGPASGGTVVQINGDFPASVYEVFFGTVAATNVQKVSNTQIRATTPPHLPGASDITLFEHDQFINTGVQFAFTGPVPDSFERLLLPVYINVTGAFGSEFRSELSGYLHGGAAVHLYGLQFFCPLSACIYPNPIDVPVELDTTNKQLAPTQLQANGTPGLFIFVPDDEVQNVALNLRVYDVSRSTQNFGTELPIVRENQFVPGFNGLTLINIPTDPNFRSTLRIYSEEDTPVDIIIEGDGIAPIVQTVMLQSSGSIFSPAFASFSNFPVGAGRVRVTVAVPNPPILPISQPSLWAVVSVTNNETQLISTVTPQPSRK